MKRILLSFVGQLLYQAHGEVQDVVNTRAPHTKGPLLSRKRESPKYKFLKMF